MAADRFTLSRPLMGSTCWVLCEQPALALDAMDRLAGLRRRWSRFDPGSEVSRLNRSGGRFTPVSADTIALLRWAQVAATVSGGLVDAGVLGDVIAAGYDTALPAPSCAAGTQPVPRRRAGEGVTAIDIDDAGGAARLPPGCGFDPGGIAKGFAADLVLGELRRAGARRAVVNCGGDLAVHAPDAPVTIAIADPFDQGHDLVRLALRSGAVATSSRVRRAWVGGHHLIDPRSHRPSSSPCAAFSALAPSAAEAEVRAKVGLLDWPAAASAGGAESALPPQPWVAVLGTGELLLGPGLAGVVGVEADPAPAVAGATRPPARTWMASATVAGER